MMGTNLGTHWKTLREGTALERDAARQALQDWQLDAFVVLQDVQEKLPGIIEHGCFSEEHEAALWQLVNDATAAIQAGLGHTPD
jgi:hypothetical protein